MNNKIETITINRTAFMGPKSIKKAKKILKKIKSLNGKWYLSIEQNKRTIELLVIENGKIVEACFYRGEDLQEAAKLTKDLNSKFISMEIA